MIEYFKMMNTLPSQVSKFTGIFEWLSPLVTYYWMSAVFVLMITVFIKNDLKGKIIIGNTIIVIGLCLFFFYLSSAFIAINWCLNFMNELGGVTNEARRLYYRKFYNYFVFRTAIILSLICIVCYVNFILSPFLYRRRNGN